MIYKKAETSTKFSPHLQSIKELLFDSLGVSIHQYTPEESSKEYAACSFSLEKRNIKFRSAKITPTKTGQFVSVWKRNHQGITCPFDASDAIDSVLISCQEKDNVGLFIFPKAVLLDKGILSTAQKEGKRGIRVYPPWDIATNNQAKNTQKWQSNYFITLQGNSHLDLNFARSLLFSH